MVPADCSSARRLWVAQPAARRLSRPGPRKEPELPPGPEPRTSAVSVFVSRRGNCCAVPWCVLYESYEISHHDFQPGPDPDSRGSKPQRAGTHCNERVLREQPKFSDAVTVTGAEFNAPPPAWISEHQRTNFRYSLGNRRDRLQAPFGVSGTSKALVALA